MKILLFENSKQIEKRLVELISEAIKEITFFKAGSYAEAIYFLNECKPDAVLLDFKYPGNSGVDLLRKISVLNNKTVTIALLSQITDSNITECKKYGADFIFDKYADFEKIPAVIRNLV